MKLPIALWRRRADEERAIAGAERRRADLRARRDRLVESLAVDRAIDRATYDRLLARLDREIEQSHFQPLAERELPEDLGALLATARPLLSDPSELWRRAAAAEKRRVQALVFPRGADLAGGELSTPETAFIFSTFRVAQMRKGEMVDQVTLSSNTPGSSNTLIFWLREVAAMRQAA